MSKPVYQPEFKKALVGRKIVAVVNADVGGELWPGLKLDDGSMLIIQRDAEGNGGGFMVLMDSHDNEVGCGGMS
jgi:hypothetical protein